MPPWPGTGNYAKNIRRTTFQTWASIFVTLTLSLSIVLPHSRSLSRRYLIFDTSDDDSVCPMSDVVAYFTGKRHGLAYWNDSIIRRATGFSALSLSHSFAVFADANSLSPSPTLFSTERQSYLHSIFPQNQLTWRHVLGRENEKKQNEWSRPTKEITQNTLHFRWIESCDSFLSFRYILTSYWIYTVRKSLSFHLLKNKNT